MSYAYGPPAYPSVPTPPPAGYPPVLSRQDEEHLNLLSILYYVYDAFIGITGLAMAVFAVIPALMIPASRPTRPADWIGPGIFLVFLGVIVLFLLAKAVFMVVTGRAFAKRGGWTLCMVGACIPLMNVPLGTALGVFAITVLQRPAVKARFGHA